MAQTPSDKNTAENSFMKSLFFGQIREDLVFPYPKIKDETKETVNMVVETLDKFGKDVVKAAEWDEAGQMPREIVTMMAEMGLTGLAVPEELNGLGLPQVGYARVMQQIASLDGGLAVTLGAHQSIGYKAILLFGNEEQRKRFLPRLATGELIGAFCLTEPSSGSDAASIQTKAELSADGKHYILSGQKLWITNGEIAGFLTVFAKTDVVENGTKKEKITCFAIELPSEGVTFGAHEHKLGIRGSWTNAMYFDKVKVPVENIVGEVGKGFKIAMGVLNHGRLGLAAGCIGVAKNAIKASIEHANERVQFNKKIGEFGMIKEKVARMVMNNYVAESMTYMTASLIDRGDVDYSMESAASKVFCSEMLWETVDENIQIWGGNGFMKEYPFERWMRDARINRIFEGTNEILRTFVALSGMQGPGQELAGLAKAIQDPLKGLGLVTQYATRKVKQNVFGANISQSHPRLKKLAGVLEEYTVELAAQVEVLIKRHGKEIHTKQFAQKRIADVAIDLFALYCTVSRVTLAIEEKGEEGAAMEIAIAEAFSMRANRRIRGNFKSIDRNEDELMKFIADKHYEMGEYQFDVFKK
jgi:acyl-CoA dehydrogenase family protein 9